MADRPWVTPAEVREYSEIKTIQERSDSRLSIDISRAEMYVITTTHNNFSKYETIPEAVKTAVILLAEAYGHNAVTVSKTLKSETFDDYSYQSDNSDIAIDTLDIAALLDEYVINEPKNGVNMRLRKL